MARGLVVGFVVMLAMAFFVLFRVRQLVNMVLYSVQSALMV